MTKEIINNYYQSLTNSFEDDTASYFFNKDRTHNSIIMSFMFERSSNINMFCGELSILRSGFYKKIEETEEVKTQLITLMKNNFDSFLKKDKCIFNIIFEHYDSKYMEDLIFLDFFESGLKSRKIRMFKLPNNLKDKNFLEHFTVSDAKIVRLEYDKEQHSAICSINNDKFFNRANEAFNRILNISIPIV